MANVRTQSFLDVIPDIGRSFFKQNVEKLRQWQAKRDAYTTTYHELSALTDRDLADLGIPRSNISKVAKEAAYGK